MSLVSRVCCQLLLWLGLVKVCRCDEWLLRGASDDSSTSAGDVTALQWFKLLFVPTLGLVILTLFMLEDHCYGHHNHLLPTDTRKRRGDPSPLLSDDLLDPSLPTRLRRSDVDLLDPHPLHLTSGKGARGRSASHHHHTHDGCCAQELDKGEYHPVSYASHRSPSAFSIASQSPSRSSSPAYPHVLFISESNQVTAYSLPPTLPLRDLLLFHSSRHNQTLEPVLVWVDGRAVDASRLSEPVERLGVVDGSSVRVEMDWKRMVETLMKDEESDAKDRERHLALTRRQRVEAQERAHKVEAELTHLTQDEQRRAAVYEAAVEERDGVAALVRAAEQRLSAASAGRQAAEELRKQRERESGSAVRGRRGRRRGWRRSSPAPRRKPLN